MGLDMAHMKRPRARKGLSSVHTLAQRGPCKMRPKRNRGPRQEDGWREGVRGA